jgi:predicted RNA-binding protein associated with RNAse of E/G family
MPETITEIKHNVDKPDQTFDCRLHRHGGDWIVISYKSSRPYHISDIHIAPQTLTLAYYEIECPYIIWKMIAPDGQLFGHYVHICEQVCITPKTVEYRDLLLDVWFFPDGRHRILDEDELQAAHASHLISDPTVDHIHDTANDIIRRFPELRATFDRLLESDA